MWESVGLWNGLWITLCITRGPLVDNSFVVCVILFKD